MRPTDAVALWRLWTDAAVMAAEANAVIAMRLWGMAGLWPVTAAENRRMWVEKPSAFARGIDGAAKAARLGKSPAEIARAGLAPLGRKTRSNARRLSRRRRGP